VSARLIHCVAFNPSQFISLVHLFTHPVVMAHAPLFVTAHHVLTLSRSHTISLYSLSHCLALSRSLTESHSLWHQLPHGIFLCQRLTPSRFIPHTSDCVLRDRTIQRTDTEPRTVRRTIQRTGNAHCCYSNCYCAHTLLCRPLLHYCCTIQHIAHHSNHCCTNTAPYSTPLVTQTYAAPNTTGPTAAAPTTVAPTTAALAMLHHTLCVAPSKHILLLTFLLFPPIIHSLAFLFFSPI
jgi:hypothetical protein